MFIHTIRIQGYIQEACHQSLPETSLNPRMDNRISSGLKKTHICLRQQLNSIVYHTIVQDTKERGNIGRMDQA